MHGVMHVVANLTESPSKINYEEILGVWGKGIKHIVRILRWNRKPIENVSFQLSLQSLPVDSLCPITSVSSLIQEFTLKTDWAPKR